MGQRYWVIGGQYPDCRFKELEPGTEVIPGPFADELQGADGMAAPDLPRPLRGDRTLLDLRGARATVTQGHTVLDRPRIIAEPSNVRGADEVLSEAALDFLAELHERFDLRRRALLGARQERQERFDAGELPDFREDTRDIRESDWTVGAIPHDLLDRRVEITGPTNAKMLINALNSGAQAFMADFEDATSPVWDELLQGQVNLRDYWLGRLHYTDPDSGKHYAVGDNPAVLMVRPRGWHLPEDHVTVNGEVVAGALFDFAIYCWNNARAALTKGSGPYFYLPKLESREEAALWSDVFAFAEAKLRLERGTIKATVLIETLPAAFEMDEILYALRENIVGLNCGRWDYIFSTIKRCGRSADRLTPDRAPDDHG